MPESGEMDQRLVNRRCAPQQHRGVTADGTLDENRRHRTEGLEFAVEAPRGQNDEPVDVVREGSCDLDLFLRMFAGIRKQHLQLGFAGRAFNRTNHGGKVRIGDVGDDHSDVARPTGLHHPRGTVRHKSELLHGALHPLTASRSNLLRTAQRARHGRGVDLGTGRHVQNRDASRSPHGPRRYTPKRELRS